MFDFIYPVIAVLEAKPSELSKGIGQCLSELVATLTLFERQQYVYGVITDGEVWEFMRLEDTILTLDHRNYHVSQVSDIIECIGFIVEHFQAKS